MAPLPWAWGDAPARGSWAGTVLGARQRRGGGGAAGFVGEALSAGVSLILAFRPFSD